MLCILYVQTSNNYPKKIKKISKCNVIKSFKLEKKNKNIALQCIICSK